MTSVALGLLLVPVLLLGYAYLLYPAVLWLVGVVRPRPGELPLEVEWPPVSIVVPVYNEERAIRRTLESLLALDYPPELRQILVVSDASTDRTESIVAGYADQGVELLSVKVRGGKTAAENAALPLLRGDIVVNTDATIRILPDSLRPLIQAFADPTVGVASGRDVSVGDLAAESSAGESGYVGYEMTVRALETRLGGIVGASGCFYAIRHRLHANMVPAALSRDFASALVARENGFRAVSVDQAVCLVPRTPSLQREYRRKIRTMARGLETLWFKRHLLNPFRYGLFAWMLFSHKLARWLVFLTAPLALLGLAGLALAYPLARLALAVVALSIGLGLVALQAPEGKAVPRLMGILGFVVASHLAGLMAWSKALRGEMNPIWEPTRRTD